MPVFVQEIDDEVKEDEILQNPLCLVAYHYMPLKFAGEMTGTEEEVWLKEITLKVPTSTRYCHVAVVGVDVSFGGNEGLEFHPFGRLFYRLRDIRASNVSGGKFQFSLEAFLQDGPGTHEWSGQIDLQILCFGEVKVVDGKLKMIE
jgi:hypothetical protein